MVFADFWHALAARNRRAQPTKVNRLCLGRASRRNVRRAPHHAIRAPPGAAPLGLDQLTGEALNCNADTAAGALAGALGADAYVVITNVAGVRRDAADPDSVIPRLTVAQAEVLLADGTLTDGMIPKMKAAIAAVRTGAKRAVLAGAGYGAIDAALGGLGTELVA